MQIIRLLRPPVGCTAGQNTRPKLRTSLPDKKPDHQQRDRAAHQCTAERRCMQQRRDPFLPHSASLLSPAAPRHFSSFQIYPPILFTCRNTPDISAYIAACVCTAAPHCSHLSYDRCLRHAFSLFLLLPRGFSRLYSPCSSIAARFISKIHTKSTAPALISASRCFPSAA